jgi:hypothetical protein
MLPIEKIKGFIRLGTENILVITRQKLDTSFEDNW